MGRFVGAFLGVLLGISAVLAQGREPLYEPYRNAVVSYQRGDLAAAIRVLDGWSIDELRRIVRFALEPVSSGGANGFAGEHIGGPTPEAAAMLHTEIVLRNQWTSMQPVARQLELAETLIRGINRVRPPKVQADREAVLELQQRWYVLVASYFLWNTNPQAAAPWLERGAGLPRVDSSSRGAVAWLDVTKGVASEMAIHLLDPECRRTGCESRGPRSPVPARLEAAVSAYRRALDRDPGMAEARLRLGRVRFLQNDRRSARVELRRALTDATTDRQRYLAHLFLGEIEQVEKNLIAARTEYEAARAVGAQYQTPHIAIGFVAQMLGEGDELKRLAAAAARAEDAERDPWWGYRNGALDEETLAWLRSRVLR